MRERIYKIAIALIIPLIVSSAGCSSARYVMRNQQEGVVAIPSNSNRWPSRHRTKAESLMAEHFPNGFEIEHEEEFVIGQTTHYNEDQGANVGALNNRVSVSTGTRSGRSTTTDQTEYRIHYRRR